VSREVHNEINLLYRILLIALNETRVKVECHNERPRRSTKALMTCAPQLLRATRPQIADNKKTTEGPPQPFPVIQRSQRKGHMSALH
jgi:hypothetical protein